MKKNFSPISWIIFLSTLIISISLGLFSFSAFSSISKTGTEVHAALNTLRQQQEEWSSSEKKLDLTLEKISYSANPSTPSENAGMINKSSQTSVFSQNSENTFGDTTFSDEDMAFDVVSNGHIIGIDPGHQGPHIDMSDTEPMGPGSLEMKAKATNGTQGSYTGLPEYQLNLDVSLKLKDLLEARGYQVIMTRVDNDTAISNKERAEYVAAQGADIFVRIHANGDDTHTSSGALTMAPSPENPYVSYLSSDSVLLSQYILDEYCEATGFKNLGVQYYDNMSGINWSTIPVTIIEMGFMTHENDDYQMSDPDFQKVMAEGIANGIDAYFE